MRHLTRVIGCTTIAVLGLSGCGSSTASKDPVPRAQPTSTGSVFPLTITRTGGIAGFQDVVVVAGTGQVTVTRKGQQQRLCQLTPEAVQRLTTAASQVPRRGIKPAATQPAFPDDMVSMVKSSAGGPVRLEDPKVGAAGKVFQELLTEVSGGASASSMCKAP